MASWAHTLRFDLSRCALVFRGLTVRNRPRRLRPTVLHANARAHTRNTTYARGRIAALDSPDRAPALAMPCEQSWDRLDLSHSAIFSGYFFGYSSVRTMRTPQSGPPSGVSK